jgi:hypothetical protein
MTNEVQMIRTTHGLGGVGVFFGGLINTVLLERTAFTMVRVSNLSKP